MDFSQPFTFLDKEMEQLSKKGMKRSKIVDKLVKIHLKDGSEQWLLVHIEVQGDEDENFSLRMFRYFYRIFDRYGNNSEHGNCYRSGKLEAITKIRAQVLQQRG